MKIYILFENPYDKQANPYIRTLMDGINNQFNDVEWGYGLSTFWNDEIFKYDIIHIHWPNVFIWHNDLHLEHNTNLFEERIKLIKSKGIKIVSTCHNLKPHYSNNNIEHLLYEISYRNSDTILHLGNYSLSLFKERYPKANNVILLHHIYDNIYNNFPTYEQSIKKLHLNKNYLYILCFGAFRNKEERNLIIKVSEYFKGKKIAILAPSFFKIAKRRNIIYLIKPLLKFLYYKYKYPNIIMTKDYVSDEYLKYYYAASHISLIQRLDILNSGNISLGFLMKNIVVGPNVGNVGLWLKETQNPTFEPDDFESLIMALEYAIKHRSKGVDNYRYAINFLTTNIISAKLYLYYNQLL